MSILTANSIQPPGRYYVEEFPRTQILPDFECVGCRRGYFGKEPVHCARCGGSAFERMYEVPEKPMEASAYALRRAREELEVVERRMVASGHRRREKVIRLLREAEERLDRALYLVEMGEESGEGGREGMAATPRELQ